MIGLSGAVVQSPQRLLIQTLAGTKYAQVAHQRLERTPLGSRLGQSGERSAAIGQSPDHQGRCNAFGLKPIKRPYRSARVAGQHGVDDIEGIEAGHVGKRRLHCLRVQISRRTQQSEFADFLVGCEEIAFDPIRDGGK